MLSCLLWKGGWGEFSRKGTLGEVPAGVPRVDVCLVVREKECRTPPILPQCCILVKGCTIQLRSQAISWEVIEFFLPLPSPDKQPGPRGSSSKSPHCCCRALVWPPSSSPDSVHSLLPVSLPPRHSLPHVARGIFLKRTSGYFPSLHKSFRNALWPAG